MISLPEFSGRIIIEKKKLRLAAAGCGIAFLVTVCAAPLETVLVVLRPDYRFLLRACDRYVTVERRETAYV